MSGWSRACLVLTMALLNKINQGCNARCRSVMTSASANRAEDKGILTPDVDVNKAAKAIAFAVYACAD